MEIQISNDIFTHQLILLSILRIIIQNMALKIPRIFGVGTDICSVQRITHMIDRGPQFLDRFLQRVLHDQEIEEFKKIDQSQEDVKQAGQYLASRWAFKEAMVKASGNTGLMLSDLLPWDVPQER